MGREALFSWHERVGAFERLMPPWERVRIVDSGKGLMEGSRVVLDMNLGPWTQPWILEHGEYKRGFLFSDHLVKGPFAEWSHRHRFRDAENGMSELEDAIEYVPIHPWVGLCAGRFIRARIERGFRYRHEILLQDCARYGAELKEPLKILVTGGTGFIGQALIPLLKTQGHAVYVLSRKAGDGRIVWNPARGELDGDTLEGFDAVVHLAGEGIMGRWTEAKKQRIYESRVGGTRLLCEALAKLKNKPRVLVSVSGVSACRDDGFLSQVGRAWEATADPARKAGIRVVHPRVSVVLSPAGGALKTMLLPFRLGLGGRAGAGGEKNREKWISNKSRNKRNMEP